MHSTGRVWAEGVVSADLGYLGELWPLIRTSKEGELYRPLPRPGGSHKILELTRCSHFIFETTMERADFHQLIVPTQLSSEELIVVEYKKEFYCGPVWIKSGLTGEGGIIAPPAIPGYRWYVRAQQPVVPFARHIKSILEL
jgi:hypothetical protein